MKRLFKRSLALLLALTMVLGNTLSMTSAAPVSSFIIGGFPSAVKFGSRLENPGKTLVKPGKGHYNKACRV